MTQKINFKKEALDQLFPLDRQYEVADSKTTGLRIMVNPSGTRTFYLYRKVKGRPQRIKIGRYSASDLSVEQARKEAKRLNSLITLGGDPHEEKMAARLEVTFSELFDRYYTEYATKHTKRPDDNKKMVEFHIFPAIGKHKVSTITPDKIRGIHSQIGNRKCAACQKGEPCKKGEACKKGQGAANRVMQVVSAVFNFGTKHGYFKGNNPCSGLQKFKSISRDRFLTKDELVSFFEAVQLEKPLFQDYFAVSLYTGARKGNVLAMKWSDIDLGLQRWRIPAGETKNQDVNIVPLSETVITILKNRKKTNDKLDQPSLYVFPGNGKHGHLKDPKKAFTRIKERMKVNDIRIHDLRRTLGSYMAIGGASLPIIGKALNHKSRDATAIYDRLSHDPVLDAVNEAAKMMGMAKAA